MNFVKRLLKNSDSGQTMIFFAILASALFATAGLAIEGGRAFVEFRRVQSASDMAALVGAQSLPCTTTDTTCITNAETLACTYATNNGFSGCTAGGSGAPSANVPPTSCSPYDFIDYGNGASNGHCQTAATALYYSYIEVKLTDNLGTVPIFNVPVTLSAHAVAKRGPQIPGDYAVLTLSPSTPLAIGGSGSMHIVGSVFSNGGIQGNGKSVDTCDGGWYSAGTVTGVYSNTTGSPFVSPPGCTGLYDTTTAQQINLPPVSDPYGSSSAPPTQPAGTTFTTCPECSQSGWWYSLPSGPWHQGGSPTGDAELFPGIYNTLDVGNNDDLYFNPGVYTWTGTVDTNHGNMCVYGSPSCMNGNCSSWTFDPNSVDGDEWYYACSPFGFFDTHLPSGGPSSLQTPTFTDGTTPLNGITFYLTGTNTQVITTHGNTGKDGDVYLAAPNPCPGTGTYSSGSNPTVSMEEGASNGVYSFGSTYTSSNHSLPRGVTQSPAGQDYPNYDFSLTAECNSSNLVWPGEFLKPQHLHFLFYIPGAGTSITMNGASGQDLTGLFYAPNAAMTILGAGSAADGPAWIDGQLVVSSANFSGNAYADVSYRPCSPGANACGSGLGSQLVE